MSRLLHTLQSPKTTVQQFAASPLQRRCKPLHGVLHQVLHAALPLKGEVQRAAQPLHCSRSRMDR